MLTTAFQSEHSPAGSRLVAAGARSDSAVLEQTNSSETGASVYVAPACVALRVLFVEDDPSDIDLLALALRKGGFEASHDVAETAEAFIAQIQRTPYDVILADYNLPSWNGMATIEILRRARARFGRA
jgi:PleD family two-component response regulator